MTLYDQFNRPIDLSALKEEQASPTVTGVRSILSGHPEAGLTPVRLATILREAEEGDAERYLELAEAMEEKDLHYRAVVQTRRLQVSQLDVTVIPASDDANDQRNAELVEEWLDRETLAEEMFDILDAVAKGFSVQEILWETSESQWMPARLAWRDPRWFRFDPDDGTTLRLIGEGGQLEDLVPYKFVVHTHKAKSGLPIRGGLARAAAWSYLFKNFDIKSWVVFAEIFGQPLRVGKYHPGATPDEKQALLNAVSSISRDASAIIPDSMAIDFIDAKIYGNIALFEKQARYFDEQISKAVLGQTMTTDNGSSNSQAQVHDEVREDIERSDAKQVAGCLNRAVIRPLIDLNHGPQKRYPRIRIGRPEEVDVPQVVDAVSKLVPLGLTVEQKQMRELLSLREPDEDENVLNRQAPAPPEQDGSGHPGDSGSGQGREDAKALAREATGAEPDAIESLVAELAASGDLATAFEPIVGPVENLVAGATSYEDLAAKLADGLKGMDTGAMADLIARATFNARALGDVEEPEG